MKRLCLSAMCLLFVELSLSDAVANVTITSETHHVWGHVRLDDLFLDQYDQQADSPVSGSAYFSDELYSYSNTGLLQVEAGSNAQFIPNSYVWSEGRADASWIFQPHHSSLRLEIDVFSSDNYHGLFLEDPVFVEIEDITTGDQLFFYNGWVMNFPNVNWGIYGEEDLLYVETFSVDPTHVYRVNLGITSTANDDGVWGGAISIAVIPAPPAILLGSIGVGFVSWLRRRRTL